MVFDLKKKIISNLVYILLIFFFGFFLLIFLFNALRILFRLFFRIYKISFKFMTNITGFKY
jgi:hypothetical protein